MQEKVKNALENLVNKWKALNLKQKITIILIAVSLIMALTLTIVMTNKTTYKRLNSEPLDINSIYQLQTQLQDSKIKNRITPDEAYIEVDTKQYQNAKKIVIESGLIDKGLTFADALSYIGMGTTADTKKEIMKQQKQEELRTTLEEMEDIEKAKVMLYMPDDTNFYLKNQQEASASVVLTTKKDLAQEQIDGIVNTIKAAVQGLDKKNIEVVDSKSNILWSGEDNVTGGINANYRLEIQRRLDIEDKTESILKQLGYDSVQANANIVIDNDTLTENTRTYTSPIEDSNKGLISQENTSTSSAKNTATATEPGLAANGGDITNYQTGNNAGSEGKSEDRSIKYELNEQVISREKATGKVLLEDSSLAATVTNFRIYRQIDAEAQNLVNDNTTWEQYKDQIKAQYAQNPVALQIPNNIQEAIQTATGINNVSLAAYELPIFEDKAIVDRPFDQYAMLALLVLFIALLAFGLIRKTAPAVVTEIEPELSVEEVLETYGKHQEYVSPIDYDAESEVKKQIEKFVDERPEAVAQLLRNWLSSDWE